MRMTRQELTHKGAMTTDLTVGIDAKITVEIEKEVDVFTGKNQLEVYITVYSERGQKALRHFEYFEESERAFNQAIRYAQSLTDDENIKIIK